MKLHKGHISFSSNEGEGSTFLLTFRKGNRHLARYIVPARIDTSILPVAEPVIEVIEPSDLLSDVPDLSDTDLSDTNTNNAPQTDKSKERIMIVEDNDELRFYLKKTFAPIYSVIDKPDGESALEYLKDKSVELIISDVMMPGIQGTNSAAV